MSIPSITEIQHQTPVMPAPVAASGGGAPGAEQQQATATTPPPAVAPSPASPPIKRGSALDLEIDFHDGTSTTVYSVVDPDSGATVFQIPMEKVLDLVAELIHRLEAEGAR